jgi:hypothetical protein
MDKMSEELLMYIMTFMHSQNIQNDIFVEENCRLTERLEKLENLLEIKNEKAE